MAYAQAVSQLSLIQQYGWGRIQVDPKHSGQLIPMSPFGKFLSAWNYQDVYDLAFRKVTIINAKHRSLSNLSQEERQVYFQSAQLFRDWNQSNADLTIAYTGKIATQSNYFPASHFNCYYETPQNTPLIVQPKNGDLDFMQWAKHNQQSIAVELKTHGALVFRDCTSLENFSQTFEAITGRLPDSYKGVTPRRQFAENIYYSTAVADGQTIPLHQEVSAGHRDLMPMHIAFFCEVPPTQGTGQTFLGDVRAITEDIQQNAPDIWQQLQNKNLTYITRYLPDDGYRTAWIRTLNPSHATISQRFGTTDPTKIEDQCKAHGSSCTWEGNWVVVKHCGIPATITVEGTQLFCNQIYLDKLSPGLCGGKINYWLAKALLYPTERSTQFDVTFDDGKPITPQMAESLLAILKQHTIVRDWQKNDLMLLDNRLMMHGKAPHEGQRRIFVAMA